MEMVSTPEVVAKFREDFASCRIRYGDMKKQLAEDMVTFIAPIRNRAADLQHDVEVLQKIMKEGRDKARESASKTLSEARRAMGINFYC